MANFDKDIFTQDEKEAWIRGNKMVNFPNINFEYQSNAPEFYKNIIEKNLNRSLKINN